MIFFVALKKFSLVLSRLGGGRVGSVIVKLRERNLAGRTEGVLEVSFYRDREARGLSQQAGGLQVPSVVRSAFYF
jgi:hypothetical protein